MVNHKQQQAHSHHAACAADHWVSGAITADSFLGSSPFPSLTNFGTTPPPPPSPQGCMYIKVINTLTSPNSYPLSPPPLFLLQEKHKHQVCDFPQLVGGVECVCGHQGPGCSRYCTGTGQLPVHRLPALCHLWSCRCSEVRQSLQTSIIMDQVPHPLTGKP